MNKITRFSLFVIFVLNTSFMNVEKRYKMLCLGDSYTIGEAVEESERFPNQTIGLLKKDGVILDRPIIIAKTGWTTDELNNAIKEKNLPGKFDFVTLLIGVNNQYRGRDLENYRIEFQRLLKKAIEYANDKPTHVFVLSIPDWGVTPFGNKDIRGEKKIGEEIDLFNDINREEALKTDANYVDITPISREAKNESNLIAGDGLHPSGAMYLAWSKLLAEKIKSKLTR